MWLPCPFQEYLMIKDRDLLSPSRDLSLQLAAWNQFALSKVVHLLLGHLHEVIYIASEGCWLLYLSGCLTTGEISGVIFQPLTVVPSFGISTVMLSSSNSTSCSTPRTAPFFSYKSLTNCKRTLYPQYEDFVTNLTMRYASIFQLTIK